MSIVRRSMVSIAANTLKILLTFITSILLARGLGVAEFGIFAFLMSSFTATRLLLDMGTSRAFFTFISKYNRSKRFYSYYSIWLFIQFVISILFIVVIAPDTWVEKIWQGEKQSRIVLAFVAVFLQQSLWIMITHIGEAQRLTYQVQSLNVIIALFHLIAVSVLFTVGLLSIETIFLIVTIEFLLSALCAFRYFSIPFSTTQICFNNMFKEYKHYCSPMIPFLWLGMISAFANTWLLQHYSGSVEQAYYSVAVQFSSISFIAVTSVLNILWKEVAEAKQHNDLSRVYELYLKTCKMLFFLSAMVAGICVPLANNIISVFLGEQFTPGAIVMSLMFVCSIWQALGAINISMYYALELTRPRVVIGMIFASISLPFTYFMLAPTDTMVPGLGLSSFGLAIKMVCLQIVSVNFSMWWLARKNQWEFEWFYQIGTASFCLLLGFSICTSINELLGESIQQSLRMFISAGLYTTIIVLVAYKLPLLFGAQHYEVERYFLTLKNLFARSSI